MLENNNISESLNVKVAEFLSKSEAQSFTQFIFHQMKAEFINLRNIVITYFRNIGLLPSVVILKQVKIIRDDRPLDENKTCYIANYDFLIVNQREDLIKLTLLSWQGLQT